MIRIISGKYRGRRIQAPKRLPVRPTTDRAKESLFNILNNRFSISDIKAVDLFSGTGNLAYELISRGCSSVLAVDSNKNCADFIKSTAEKLEMENISVIQSSAIEFLDRTSNTFDLILADPPYDYTDYEDLLEIVFARDLLTEGGVLIIEHDSRVDLSMLDHFDDNRRYGNSSFSFFSKS